MADRALAGALVEFDVTAPELVADTGQARVWKVRRRDGSAAALKLYARGTMGNEAPGFAYLSAVPSEAAAQVYQIAPGAALSEWLPGPSLGDLVRQGQDRAAGDRLLAVACRLHARPWQGQQADLTRLEDWFVSLSAMQPARDWPADLRRDLIWCQIQLKQLLASQDRPQPLHGDLHHDNVRQGARGDCAFDAKGLLGDRCYELANALRNPKGVPDRLRDPWRILSLADSWAAGFGVDRARLLRWAAVKCALSLLWRSGPTPAADRERDLLSLLVRLADPASG